MYRNVMHVNRMVNFFLDRDTMRLHHLSGQVGGATLTI